MKGVLETVLIRLCGRPTVSRRESLELYEWRDVKTGSSSVLYKALDGLGPEPGVPSELNAVYGDCLGGSLLNGSLRVALIHGSTFDLYRIDQLRGQPEVQTALKLDRQISYFMDAANVWFYGVKGDDLFVYDAETAELDQLGPISRELERLLRDWREA